MLGISAIAQLALAELPPVLVGVAGEVRRLRQVERSTPWERTLSRQTYAELQQLLAAERAAAEAADNLSDEAGEALLGAADAAREAAEALAGANAERAQAERLTRELQAATAASTVADIIARAEIARREAQIIIDRLRFDFEQEEDALALLLMD